MARSSSKGGKGGKRAKTLASTRPAPLVVNGWSLFFHPCVLEQLVKVVIAARQEEARGATSAAPGPSMKLLTHLWSLITREIPQDPGNKRYRLGNTLGNEYKHWYRGKTGNGRYRLFYRYQGSAKTIVFGWLNDELGLRTYGASTDAYAVFRSRLANDTPPDDWEALMVEAAKDVALADAQRFLRAAP